MVVVWSESARQNVIKQRQWYQRNMGLRAADKFIKGILADVKLITVNPQIGRLDETINEFYGQQKWRSILSGRKYHIVYCVEGETLQIEAIWASIRDKKVLKRIIKKGK